MQMICFRGEFGLEIYANDPEADGNSLYHAYQYLIICTDVAGVVEPLPTLPPGYLGTQPTFKKLGLTTVSSPDPYIQSDTGDLQVGDLDCGGGRCRRRVGLRGGG